MTLHSRIAAISDRLTASDRRLLEVLLSHPTEAAFITATQVAERAGVHQTTATKLAQKLGYSGYPDLRRSLQGDLFEGGSPGERVRRRLDHTGDAGILDALVDDELAALRDLPRQVPQDVLDAAAAILVAARHRYVFARGNSTVLGDLLVRRLRRFGMPSQHLSTSGRDLAEQLVSLGPDDVVVAFAFLRPPPHLDDLLAHARECGARVVLITDTLSMPGGTDNLTISAARGTGREFQSLTVPMAIANALVLTVARTDPAGTGAALSNLEKLLDRFNS